MPIIRNKVTGAVETLKLNVRDFEILGELAPRTYAARTRRACQRARSAMPSTTLTGSGGMFFAEGGNALVPVAPREFLISVTTRTPSRAVSLNRLRHVATWHDQMRRLDDWSPHHENHDQV